MKMKTDFESISILFIDIRYSTRSIFPDLQAGYKIVLFKYFFMQFH